MLKFATEAYRSAVCHWRPSSLFIYYCSK